MIGLAIVLITVWIVLVISSIPLVIAVRMLGGEATIFMVILTNLIVGVVGTLIYFQFPAMAGILSFVVLLLIYSFMFRLTFLRAFLAWVLQAIIAFLLLVLAVLLFRVPLSLPL